jgi:ribosomal protein S18 acetylase RimI-like enzyme
MTAYEPSHIREMTPADLPQVLSLWNELIEHHKPISNSLYQVTMSADMTYERWLMRRLKEDGAQVWLAVRNEEIVGYVLIMMGFRSPVYEVNNVGMICDLIVTRSLRRQSIATSLVSHAMLALLNQGVKTVQVNYDHENAEASLFWTKMGFAPRLIEAYRHLQASDIVSTVHKS